MSGKFQGIVTRFSASPKQLFQIDTLGALLSALFTATLARFENTFGMPAAVLYPLAAIACLFALYSSACLFCVTNRWRIFLWVIATANTLYGITTFAAILYFYQQLTLLGLLYFFWEVIVVTCLVSLEVKVILTR